MREKLCKLHNYEVCMITLPLQTVKRGTAMENSIFFERFYQLCRQNGTTPNAIAPNIGASSGSITAWKKGAMPRSHMVKRIAEYFGVSVDYLMGYDVFVAPSGNRMTKDDLKFALFGGDGEISDEMLDEVRQFAQFLKERK